FCQKLWPNVVKSTSEEHITVSFQDVIFLVNIGFLDFDSLRYILTTRLG
ncbi:unnamed protein product, partial [marine sediment metagenome]